MNPIPKTFVGKPSDYPLKLSAKEVRRRFLKLLGPFQTPSVPLKLKVTDEKILDGDVIQQRVEYFVEKGERVPALHLFLKGLAPDAPGVLAIHEHGGDSNFPLGKAIHAQPDVNDPRRYAYHAARAGFRVLAPDALAFGERQSKIGGTCAFGYEIVAHAELCSRGKSLAWKSVWDNSRAIEVLEKLGARKIGAIGHSGGSTQNYILTSVNPKVRAAVCTFSFCTLRHQFYQHRLHHCLYHYIPGMMKAGIDWDQVVALAAPRKFFFGWGDQDDGSPSLMYRAFVGAIRARCRLERLPSSIEVHEEKGCPHRITPAMLSHALDFLKSNLA